MIFAPPSLKPPRAALFSVIVFASSLASAGPFQWGDGDGDEIPDPVEIALGLDPGNAADGLLDLDMDGFSNVDEYRSGHAIDDAADNPTTRFVETHQKVFAYNAQFFRSFSYSVAIDGDTAVIGQGQAAYVFTLAGGHWSLQQELTPAPTPIGFGVSVAVDGDTAIVGAHLQSIGASNAGAAYVFTRTAGVWSQQAQLSSATPLANAHFGNSVAVEGDTAIVGAYADGGMFGGGAAYVFTRAGGAWTQRAQLTAFPSGAMGFRVAISGDTVAVSGHLLEDVFIFTRNTFAGPWTQQAQLAPSGLPTANRFGAALDLQGDTVLVGTFPAFFGSGEVYVFTRTAGTWTEQQILSSGVPDDEFGWSIGLDGDRAVVGASKDNGVDSRSGAAYLYELEAGSWTAKAKLIAGDAKAGQEVGFRVAFDGDTALVSAPYDSDAHISAGAAYFFDVSDSDDDGLRDGYEVFSQLDPQIADMSGLDPDMDGLSSLEEQWLGTNATNPDTDGDGLEDGDEVARGKNPLLFTIPHLPAFSPVGSAALAALLGTIGMWGVRRTR